MWLNFCLGILVCSFLFPDVDKDLSHIAHWCGSVIVCVRSCTVQIRIGRSLDESVVRVSAEKEQNQPCFMLLMVIWCQFLIKAPSLPIPFIVPDISDSYDVFETSDFKGNILVLVLYQSIYTLLIQDDFLNRNPSFPCSSTVNLQLLINRVLLFQVFCITSPRSSSEPPVY